MTDAELDALCRKLRSYYEGPKPKPIPPITDEAADAIAALREQVAAKRPMLVHVPHHEDESSDQVCEGLYAEKVDDVLGLVEALNAIIGVCGGYDEQSKAITKIAEDAIKQHAAWVEQ